MEDQQTEGISKESDLQDNNSTEKCEGLNSKNLSNVKLTSAATDSTDNTTDMKPKDDVKENKALDSKSFEAKTVVSFKFPGLPSPSSSKISKPKTYKHDKSPKPAAGNSGSGDDVRKNLNQAAHSQLQLAKQISENPPSTCSTTNEKEISANKNPDRTGVVSGDVSSAGSVEIVNKKDVFTAPSLPSKQNRPQQQVTKPDDSSTNDVKEKETESNSSNSVTSESQTPNVEKKIVSSNSSKVKPQSDTGSKLSPAEKRAQAVPVPYKEPSWSGVSKQAYHLEVLKGGSILSKIPLNVKPFLVFGRFESCDVMLEHPSLSRFHMVLQYRQVGDSDCDPGFYVYDLDSTHGSFLNKQKLEPKTYCRIQVGHMFKLAGSTRLYILQGPPSDEKAESELSVTELKQMREKQLAELEKHKMKKMEDEEEKQSQEEEKRGISWGMDDDAEEEDPSEVNPFAMMTTEEREALYIKDPKKTLRGFFEREGYELEYDCEEKDTGHGKQFICRVQLPVDDAEGSPITAETVVAGKKKEAVVACALEACRILDAHGVLRQAKHESKKRKAKNWAEDDYYDSDDDTFLDRTGEIEKKRQARMKKAGVVKDEVETFASLTVKLAEVEAEMKQIDEDIESLKNASSENASDDSLDAFMSSIKSGTVMDKTKRAKLKIHKIELRKEQAKLLRLINIAKPAALPQIKRQGTSSKDSSSSSSASTKKLPMIGSLKGRPGARKFKFVMPIAKPVTQPAVSSTTDDVEEEEEEDEEEEEVEEKKESRVEPMETDRTEENVKDVTGSTSKDDIVSSSASIGKKNQTDGNGGKTKQSKLTTKGPSIPPSRRVKGPTLPPKITIKGPSLPPTLKGPTLPPGLDTGDQKGSSKRSYDGEDDEDEDNEHERKKTPKKVTVEAEEDVADWHPPEGQTGDGRTSLNEKFGY